MLETAHRLMYPSADDAAAAAAAMVTTSAHTHSSTHGVGKTNTTP